VTRILKYVDALREGTADLMAADRNVFVIGLGVPGPTGIFGSTTKLLDRFGKDRVLEMPASENGMTGVILGASIVGMRPIMVHMRMDFAVLSMEPLVNQAAKWHYMYGGKMRAPITIRMIIGRGWGQGPQHSQSLQAWFAHVPGLKVVMPTTAYDAKGMLISAVEDDAPVIVVEHRWLYGVAGEVPEGLYRVPLDEAVVRRTGTDVTIAATSYMTLEALRAAELLDAIGISAEVVDLRSLTPIDTDTLFASVRKTGRLVTADTGHAAFGVAAEVTARVAEGVFSSLKCAPRSLALPQIPTPTSPALADHYYPVARDIAQDVLAMLDTGKVLPTAAPDPRKWMDVPDPAYKGPY
jgi:acetoin:2,6-dichlorophenolindophenol oxidoreductase subunit beta